MSSISTQFISLRESWMQQAAVDHVVPPKLVHVIARLLHRPIGGPGYAVMRGSAFDLDIAKTRSFQVLLLCEVWQEMSRRGWLTFQPSEVRLNRFEAVDGDLPRDIVGDVVTFKRLHFDPFSVIFAHLYEEPKNLAGGTISLVDVSSYLEATGRTLDDAFEPLFAPGHNGRLVARDLHRQQMLQTYSRTVDPPRADELMLLLVRNDPMAGVAHEIAEVSALDTATPTMRRFYRASIAPHH